MTEHDTPAMQRLRAQAKQWDADRATQPPLQKTLMPSPNGITPFDMYVHSIDEDKHYKLHAKLTDFVHRKFLSNELDSEEWTDYYSGTQLKMLLRVASTLPEKGDGYRLDVIQIVEQEGHKA